MQKRSSLIVYFLLYSNLLAFDRSFFYRTSSFWDEPRLECPNFSTINFQFSGGSTKLKCCDTKLENKFKITEINSNLYQNFYKGIFYHFHLPIVLTETQTKSFPQHKGITNNGLSDSTLFIGWAINYEKTCYVDFVDLSLQIGPLFPTGKIRDSSNPFKFALGYNGHWGLSWCVDLSIGYWDWLTIGLHNDGIFFFDSKEKLFLEFCSFDCQKKTTEICKEIKSEPVWRVGSFLKADHICWGLSFLISFAYEQKNNSYIACKNPLALFETKIEELKEWSRWLMNIVIEYDYANETKIFNPCISLFYNHQIKGKRVFNTDIIGSNLNLNMCWKF